MNNLNKKNILIAILVLFVIFIIVGYNLLSKNQPKPNGAEIVSQNDHTFKLKLDLNNNSKNGKSIVRYAVLLFKLDESGKILGESPMDLKTYSDGISLDNIDKKFVSREISYTAPDYLQGKYAMVVDYFDESGSWPFSITNVGNVSLKNKNSEFVEIIPEKCSLQVEGDKSTATLTQGVDVAAQEKLFINCSLKNNSDKEIVLTPNFENFRRNYLLGELNGHSSALSETISIKSGETKSISLPIVKAVDPQAYDAALYFTDDSGKKISNRIFAHYILFGESATIKNASLDKNYYIAGESAKLSASFYGSADSFKYSRLGGTKNKILTAKIDIKDKDGISCLSEEKNTSLNLENMTNIEFTLTIKKKCQDPFVNISVMGEGGKILDERIFMRGIK